MADEETKPEDQAESTAGETTEDLTGGETTDDTGAAEEPQVAPPVDEPPPPDKPAEVGPEDSVPATGSASSFALKNEAVLKELKDAEDQAMKTAALVETLQAAIHELTKKENFTEEDASLLQLKQNELMLKLNEFERVTKRIQDLIGLKNVSSAMLGPPMQCRDFAKDPCQAIQSLKVPNLPKVIICGNESTNQIPKMIVCEPVDNNSSNKPVYQQLPIGGPGQGTNNGPGPNRGFLPPGSVDFQFGPPQMGQQFAGTIPGPVRQIPGVMGQPPTMMGIPQMVNAMPQMGGRGLQMGMPPQMGGMVPQMGMPPQMGQARGMMPSQQRWPPGSVQQNFQGFPGGMGAIEPYRTGPQEFTPPVDGNRGGPDQSSSDIKTQLQSLQEEMKKLTTENEELKKKLECPSSRMPEKPLCKMSLGKVPVCKMDMYNQLGLPFPKPGTQQSNMPPGKCMEMMREGGPNCKMDLYRNMGIPCPGLGVGGDATRDVETMVASMEEEVRSIQKELDGVQAERRSLELQKKVLQCVAPLVGQDGKGVETVPEKVAPLSVPTGPPSQIPGGSGLQSELQYRELVEKYNKLQENFNLKIEEVSLLRVELDNARRESTVSIDKTKDAEARVDDLLERLKSAEAEEKKIQAMKEQMIDLEQQLILAKQRFREASEEVEGIRTELNDLKMQTDEYREKYMKAQQTVEEQKNQLDMKNLEATRYQEQFMLEFQRIKTHFQSKLEELTPYPEMLKKIQNKLREAIHLKALAEKNCMTMSKNLESANEERESLRKTLDEINKNKSATEAEKASLQGNLTDGEKRMEETKAENSKLKAINSRLEEHALQSERKYEEKVQEVLQLQSQLETLREESARQVARTKDYCENVRKSLLTQISDLERQVAAAKATAKLAQQDRDVIRQKMQAQITHLNDNFEQAQMRIRNLQSHVNYLKSSFTNMIAPVDMPLDKILTDGNT